MKCDRSWRPPGPNRSMPKAARFRSSTSSWALMIMPQQQRRLIGQADDRPADRQRRKAGQDEHDTRPKRQPRDSGRTRASPRVQASRKTANRMPAKSSSRLGA